MTIFQLFGSRFLYGTLQAPGAQLSITFNWLLGLWRQYYVQLGTELTPSQLSEVKNYVQVPRKYINVGSTFFLFK